MSIDITLRFRRPEEVMTFLEIVSYAVNDAEGCYSDNGDPVDAITMADYIELRDALWACFLEQGFVFIGDPGFAESKVMYQGRELTYQREPNVAPLLKEAT